jgi:hypothetical protein
VDLPEPFVLNASLPYYFHIGVSTNPAHFGIYVISVQELENGRAFTDYLKVETCDNRLSLLVHEICPVSPDY